MTEVRTFRRTAGTRIVGAACALLFVAGTISVGASYGLSAGFFVLAGLSILSLANALGAWADRYTLGATGLEYRNALMAVFGARPRLVPWEEVVQVREHRSLRFGRLDPQPSALFLVLRSGRRVVLDSLQDFDALRTAVHHYCGRAQ
jgi:PH (Pleckstrin Homology) domain-containing protein